MQLVNRSHCQRNRYGKTKNKSVTTGKKIKNWKELKSIVIIPSFHDFTEVSFLIYKPHDGYLGRFDLGESMLSQPKKRLGD
jgi:hypothetical protein